MDNTIHRNLVNNTEGTLVVREHKSRLFCFIFGQDKDLLVQQRAEVKGMLLEEYDEAEIEELFKEEGRREGMSMGRQQGKDESITKLASHYVSNDPLLSMEEAMKMASEILA